MKNLINKILTIVVIAHMVVLNTIPVVSAQEVSPSPEPTSAVVSSEVPEPTPTETTPEFTSSDTPSTPSDSSNESVVSPTPDPISNWNNLTDEEKDAYRDEKKEQAESQYLAAHGISQSENGSGNTGSTSLATGDAQANGAVVNSANNNLASSALNGDSGPSVSVINSDNGSSSSNSGSATILNNDTTDQDNSAHVISGLDGDANTGKNDGNYNVGATNLSTGDANTTGTIISAVNTNVDGVMVSEFNIVDDHIGDIVLDFNANCISGCGSGGLTAQNTGNGAFSENNANAQTTTNNNTFQNNDGTVNNEMVLGANSGDNETSYNTGGDATITTGDANIAGNALTFLNNNIAGNVVFSVVNIFGDLVGDIIFPESQFAACCGGSGVSAANTGNGAGSTNDANASTTTNNATFQTNDATINNNLVFDATTGNNDTNYNTGGNSSINTGQANVDANVLNIANTNISGGNMWLVLINHAGNWVGKLIGAPEGQSYLGSEGLEFSISPTGEISASNNSNGAGSTNDANASTTTNNTVVQNNTGTVNNTLRFDANTGGNEANYNTGGNSSITTGDANIIANLVNFVNNNISGGGKLFVTIVNVFGSWTGDFVGPGMKQDDKSEIQNPKSETNSNVQNSNNGSNPSNSSSPSNSSGLARLLSSSTPSNSSLSGSDTQTGNLTLSSNFNNTGNTNNSTTSGGSNTGNPQSGLLAYASKVAGANTKGAEKEKVKINLAWLVLLLPVALLVLVGRKLLMRRDL